MPMKKKLEVSEKPKEELTIEQQAIQRFEGELAAEGLKEEITEREAEAQEVVDEPEALYIIKETIIDKYSVKRERVKITPAVCDKCGFDVSARNGLGHYDDMSPVLQEQVRGAIAEHKSMVHTIAQDLIVKESELPTKWLGQHKKF